MKDKLVRLIANLLVLILVSVSFSYSQERDKIESVLRNFKNWRFGNISLYEIKNLAELRKHFKSKEEKTAKAVVNEECVKKASPEIVRIVEEAVASGKSFDDVVLEIINRGLTLPEDLQCIYDVKRGIGARAEQQIERAYLITTRAERDGMPEYIIGLIVSYDDTDNLKKSLRAVNPSYVFSYRELKEEKLIDTSFKARTLYDLMVTTLVQGNVENRTLDAQGIGTDIAFAPKVFGITSSMVYDENFVDSRDIQDFIKVSEGLPLKYYGRSNELIISPDLLSWRLYEKPILLDKNGDPVIDSATGSYAIDPNYVTNSDLPRFGIELKYGIDEINYPSYWSERLTLSAILKNVKLGVILPTGYMFDARQILTQDRKLTYGGIGISASMDFPVQIIPQSGIFRLGFGYVFGDAVESKYKKRNLDPDTYVENIFDNDYLIRANGQLHYTFGVKIDDDYMLRFGILASAYQVERWYNKLTEDDEGNKKIVFTKRNSEVVAGISGRIDFMATNVTWPFGASVQYFDEALGATAWLVFPLPIFDNSLALRLDAKGFFPIFRDKPREWENNNIFVPMVRLIYNF